MSVLLYVYSEKGEMHLAKPDPKAFVPVSQFTISEGTEEHWAHLTIAGGRLYIRHGDAMIKYDIKPDSEQNACFYDRNSALRHPTDFRLQPMVQVQFILYIVDCVIYLRLPSSSRNVLSKGNRVTLAYWP